MPRKTTILIIILALLTGILIFLAVRREQSVDIVNKIIPTPIPQTKPYALLSFSKEFIEATASGQYSVDIILDTKGKSVSGAQAEISYDPKIITNVQITTAKNSIFGTNGNTLFSLVDPKQGRISYAVGIPIDGEEVDGIGPIATVTFNINISNLFNTTQMTFLPKSAVTTLSTQQSVLLNTQPLQIIAGQDSLPTNQ